MPEARAASALNHPNIVTVHEIANFSKRVGYRYSLWQRTPAGQEVQVVPSLYLHTKTLAKLPKPLWFGLSVSPDERSILYSQVDIQTSDIRVVEHFQ